MRGHRSWFVGALVALTMGACAPGPDAEAALGAQTADAGVPVDEPEQVEPVDETNDKQRPWYRCTQRLIACRNRNASIDPDYIMEPCDLDFEICIDW